VPHAATRIDTSAGVRCPLVLKEQSSHTSACKFADGIDFWTHRQERPDGTHCRP